MLHLFWPPKSLNLHFKWGDINVSSNQQFVISQNNQQVNHSKGIIMTIMMSQGVKQTKTCLGDWHRRAQTARRGRTSRVCSFSDVDDNWGVNGSIANFKSEYFIVFFYGKTAHLSDLNVRLKDVLVSFSLLTKATTPADMILWFWLSLLAEPAGNWSLCWRWRLGLSG